MSKFSYDEEELKNLLLPEESYPRDLILRRRRQLCFHSHVYYDLDDSFVSDHKWQYWANQLVFLQAKYGEVLDVFSDDLFKGWDGSTGCHLTVSPREQFLAERLVKASYIKDNEKPF